ncbi:MAG: acetyl-CoA C-acetyltransferase [Pusillimonas sp.]
MQAYIYDHVRTPRARSGRGGSFREITPTALAATALRSIRDRSQIDTTLIDDVSLGCVAPVGEQGANIARTALLMADFDQSVPGVQVHRYCSSGLETCNTAAAQIAAGVHQLAVAGGVESLSRVPLFLDGGSVHSDPEVATYTGYSPQGVGADVLATLWGFSREDVDAFAVRSHQRAAGAWDAGYFNRSVAPVIDDNGMVVLARDEAIRASTSMESLSALKPSFEFMGVKSGFDAVCQLRYPHIQNVRHIHHAGNSSGIVDGASAVLLGTREIGSAIGLKPRARIRSYASVGSDPTIMLTGPAPAARKALDRAGMSISDIDLFEINEAFAAVPLAFMAEMNVDPERVNVNGGSIAMGHPLGATGAILVGTLIDELERRNLQTGMIAICVGAGMGTATIIERI